MLEGIRVVELGIWVAGPAAGGMLADWGADVIKIEAPSGDPFRSLFGAIGVGRDSTPPPFELDNRGKRSVELNLQTERDREHLEALLATADVFITNLRIDALERLGLDPDSTRKRHPKLIYAIVTGYGLTGPDRDRAGYDIGAFWARSSLAHTTVPPGELPPPLRSGSGDHATGTALTAGICAALVNRMKTGEGRLVHTSLLRTGIYLAGWDLTIRQNFGRIASTRPRTKSTTPVMNSYAAGDGKGFWLIGVEQDRHWPPVLRSIGREDLAEDPRFATAIDRSKNAEAVIAILDEEFAKQPLAHWTARFDEQDVWWAPINSLADVLEDEQAIAIGSFIDQPAMDGTMSRSVATPIDFSDEPLRPRAARPKGADTDEVLAELGRTR